MAEYIDREAALDTFGDVPPWRGYFEPYPPAVHMALTGVVKVIRD